MPLDLLKRLFHRPKRSASLPQLDMLRDDLERLPDIVIPEGYDLRTFEPGDETAWCEIMEGNVGSNWTVEACREKMTSDPRFDPGNLFFATIDGQPVGSACAWTKNPDQRDVGEVHMVAVLDSHRGKGLGHLVNAAVLHRLRDLGYKQAHLLTDAWRVPAIKSYLRAGFKPLHTHITHPERWRDFFEQIGVDE